MQHTRALHHNARRLTDSLTPGAMTKSDVHNQQAGPRRTLMTVTSYNPPLDR